MPNRIIKESICVSEDIDALSWFEEVVFYRLLVNCDDFGRYDGRPAVIKGKLFPLKEEKLKTRDLTAALNKLAKIGLIAFYNGGKNLYVTKWENHQNIRAKKSKFPDPVASDIICNQMQSNDINCDQMNANVADTRYSILDTRYSIERTRETRPTVEEVAEYCKERNNGIDPQHFIDYYEQQDWKLSNGNSMKDWRAAVRNWERREKKPEQKRYGGKPDPAIIRASFEMLKREQEEGA